MTAHGSCVSWDELSDWWAGELVPSRADELEEHLLGCDACATRASRLADLVRDLGSVVRSGAIGGVTTPALLARLERDGVRVHRYRIAPGQVVPCSVWPEDQVMATVLDVRTLAAGDTTRFDVLARVGDEPALRVADVPLDRTSGTVTWLSTASVERRRPATSISFQVLRVTGEQEVVAAEYTLAHEPWAGPASPR